MRKDDMDKINTIKEAIKTAIQMEKDGYAFYQKAAAQTSSDMGKSIFESIAKDELLHLDVFQKIFEEKVGKSEWENLVDSSKKYQDISVFPKDLKEVAGGNPDSNELDALRIAMDSEKDAIDYYNEIWENSDDDVVRKIIDEIIGQEKNHYFILEQEFNHLSSTGYWYEMDYLGG
jgi:rubrerythrin